MDFASPIIYKNFCCLAKGTCGVANIIYNNTFFIRNIPNYSHIRYFARSFPAFVYY